MCRVPNNKNSIIVRSDEKYLYARVGKKTFYVACTYTANSVYDEEGAPVVVKIVADDNIDWNPPDKVWCTYNCKDEEGNVYEWSSGKIKFKVGSKTKNIITLFDSIFEKCTGIKGMVDYRINDKVNNWDKILTDSIIKTGHIYDDKNYNYFVFARLTTDKITINDKDTFKTILYKIYPTPLKVSEIKEPDTSPIKIDGTTGEIVYEVGNEGGNKLFELYGSTTQGWKSSCEDSWYRVSPSNGKGATSIKVTVDKNNKTTDREGKIIRQGVYKFGTLDVVQK
jgi:hypothetical protein